MLFSVRNALISVIFFHVLLVYCRELPTSQPQRDLLVEVYYSDEGKKDELLASLKKFVKNKKGLKVSLFNIYDAKAKQKFSSISKYFALKDPSFPLVYCLGRTLHGSDIDLLVSAACRVEVFVHPRCDACAEIDTEISEISRSFPALAFEKIDITNAQEKFRSEAALVGKAISDIELPLIRIGARVIECRGQRVRDAIADLKLLRDWSTN